MEQNHNHHSPLKELYGVIFFFFILLFVYSKFGPSVPFSVLSQEKGEPLVVSGTGKVTVAPDVAKVSVGIDQNGSSLKTVQDSVNSKSKALVNTLKDLGVDEEDIKTTSYNVSPQYDYSSPTQRITGYSVSTTYQVTIKDFDSVNNVVVAATSAGANLVGGITFEVNDVTKKEKLQEAREIAVKEAKEKAESLAKASGVTLGKVINVSENESFPGIREFAAMPIQLDSAASKEITPAEIQPGEKELTVNINLSFEVR